MIDGISHGRLTYVFNTDLFTCVIPRIIHNICCKIKLKHNNFSLADMLDWQSPEQQLTSHPNDMDLHNM